MADFRTGLMTAALATAMGLALTAVSARAQDSTPGQAPVQAQVPAQAQDPVQAPVQAQGQAQTTDQDKVQTADHAQNQAENISPACPGNPDALGTSRVLPIDFSAYQQLGRMQYPDSLPLDDKEVVITFDDGPLPPYTDQVLDILATQCVKATFFMVGEMAHSFPATVRRVYEQGHTIGTHSDHHPIGFGKLPLDRMRAEIDGGIADVSAAFGGDSRYLAPFFRIPGLERSDLLENELAERGLIIFSADVVADDWHRDITPAKITALAISRLEARGKGILLLHDIHPKTVAALPGLLQQLKQQGFRVVQVVPSAAYEMAMARKPAARMLASAMPGELMIEDDDAARPIWPHAADDSTPDAAVLPVPDAAAFEPDADLADDSGAVRWPDIPKAAATQPTPGPVMRRGKHAKMAAHSERRKHDVARSADHKRAERDRRPEHSRARARAGTDGHTPAS
jgi:peptidoglycan/xylan/chitin deacetylase (PgdA/CDA1 family)